MIGSDTMIDPALKEYLDLFLIPELKRLSTIVESQAVMVRSLETTMTSQVTQIKSEISSIWHRVDVIQEQLKERTFTIEKEEAARQQAFLSLQAQIKAVDESQKFRWQGHEKEQRDKMDAQAERDQEQAVLNKVIADLEKKFDRLTWLIASTIILLIIYGLFDLLKLRAAGGG